MIRKGKWEHIRSGRVYDVLNTCRLKVGGEWVTGILYTTKDSDQLFVRNIQEFKEKFVEWKKS